MFAILNASTGLLFELVTGDLGTHRLLLRVDDGDNIYDVQRNQ
jgi:hypothetical protein